MASSIASMTMPLSISFSRATASAMASSSALLALTAAGAVAMSFKSTFHLDCVGAFGAERRGGCDELVGQEQLGRRDCRKWQCVGLVVAGPNKDKVALDTPQFSGELLATVVGLDQREPGFLTLPVLIVLEPGQW